jgi:beta-phosphoglucomutase
MELISLKCKPVFYHQYALSRLKQSGYRLAVASNSISRTVESMMMKSDLLQYLEFFLSNEDVNKAKPDPEIYNTAIQKLGLKPEECVIVEDNFNGVKAARASGAHVLEVARVEDVNLANITDFINACNGEEK